MWRSRTNSGRQTVICIACGSSILQSDAREYDKEGDRWERRNKVFEHVCKPCHSDLCRQPRDGLEALLVDVGAGEVSQEAFLGRYLAAVETERDSPEDAER